MDRQMWAENIADEARASISDFCINECKAYCCRNGFLIIKPHEIDAVSQGSRDELLRGKSLKRLENGSYSLNLDAEEGGCPSLKGNKCLIHASKLRPKTCGDFPVYVKGDAVFFSPRCLAVKQNRFFPYEKAFIALGYRILEASPWADIGLGEVSFPAAEKKEEKKAAKETGFISA